MPKDFFLWKYSIIFLICRSHPWLIKIRFQSSNCMDLRLLAIILFHSFLRKIFPIFVYQKVFISFDCCSPDLRLKQGWDKTCTNGKEYFDNILTVHLGKVICASLACCAIFDDMPPVPLFFSTMNLRTYPSILKISCKG